jgi:BirA family transcriptional regulator, biotin operon repressor / biotin---[acetyl-CoA-carboxylase] ligase
LASIFSIGTPFIELQQVESTNNYATALAHEGMAQHGAAVFAHHQTKGKGQRYKQWHSEAGKNISLSVLLQPEGIGLSQSFLMSMATAVGVYRFFSNYVGDETKIKWPNDIYWRDRKAAGILIENIIQGDRWKWCIAGIGVNINQTAFTEIATKATSLKQVTGKDFDPLALSKELCSYLEGAYKELHESENSIISAYKKALFKLNEPTDFKKDSEIFTGIVRDVTTSGLLVIQGETEQSFAVGEIEWLI